MPLLRGLKKPILFLLAFWLVPAGAATLEPFTAEYKFYYADWQLGTSTYSLKKTASDRYLFSFASSLKILVFTDFRKVTSEFVERANRLYPLRYRHERTGTGADYVDMIVFDQKQRRITSTISGESVEMPYDAQLLDGLTVQFQLMLDVKRSASDDKSKDYNDKDYNDKDYNYSVLEGNVVEPITFTEMAPETITIEGKRYECVVFEAKRRGGRLKTDIWFAKNLGFLPVQLAHFVNGSRRFNARLAHYSKLAGPALQYPVLPVSGRIQ